ncbi:MAG: protocatechuate 3,4-dioxygenase [Planctomycetota bacterium]
MSTEMHAMRRRRLLQSGILVGSTTLFTPGVFADLIQTPSQTEGPFYPDKMPLDTDNDLLVINDQITPAVGEITHMSGRVMNQKGEAVRNAFVEIWQVDNNAVYIHSGDKTNRANQDKNFQGYGRFLTDSKGRYYFRTIKPVPYPGRTPHIHIAVSRGGKRVLTTQLYVKGHEGNQRDGLLNRLDAESQKTLLGDFKPLENSSLGELTVTFDIILGRTAVEGDDGELHGVGKSQWRQSRSSRG